MVTGCGCAESMLFYKLLSNEGGMPIVKDVTSINWFKQVLNLPLNWCNFPYINIDIIFGH